MINYNIKNKPALIESPIISIFLYLNGPGKVDAPSVINPLNMK
jgi:hypothetical protein